MEALLSFCIFSVFPFTFELAVRQGPSRAFRSVPGLIRLLLCHKSCLGLLDSVGAFVSD